MKNLLNSALRWHGNSVDTNKSMYGSIYNAISFTGLAIVVGILFTACKKEDAPASVIEAQNVNSRVATQASVVNEYSGLSAQTSWELRQVRGATARYRDIKNAIKDGYADISVVVPNMGYHYMKSSIVDATFNIREPEILVYNKEEDGSFQLVAAEYAVPIDLSTDAAPEGFTGSQDVWDQNTGFGLWLFHAWI
jgi:hypothetical protein